MVAVEESRLRGSAVVGEDGGSQNGLTKLLICQRRTSFWLDSHGACLIPEIL